MTMIEQSQEGFSGGIPSRAMNEQGPMSRAPKAEARVKEAERIIAAKDRKIGGLERALKETTQRWQIRGRRIKDLEEDLAEAESPDE